jgi:hypothetical protein
VLKINGLRTIRIDQRAVGCDWIALISARAGGGRFGMAHTFFPGEGMFDSRAICVARNVRDGTIPSVFGDEGKFGSITRSSKLYSTTRAVLRRWGD